MSSRQLNPAALPAVALALSLTIGTAPAEPIAYDVYIVEAFNPEYSLREVYVWDINDVNRAIGTSTHASYYAAYTWEEPTDKTMIGLTWPRGIDNLGRGVESNVILDTRDGTTTIIPDLVGAYPFPRAMDINVDGIVVGYARNQQSDSDGVNRTAMIWDAVNGSRALGIPAARELLRINESNVAVGNIRPSASADRAFVYDVDTGEHVNLSDLLPPAPTGTPWSTAADINDMGVVCGEAWNGTTLSGFTWSETGGFTFLPGLDGGETMRVHPKGIDGLGHVVGYAMNGSSDWHAFIWDEADGMRDLNDLAAVPGAYILDRAQMINENGWIVGDAHEGPGWGTARGFVLKPADGQIVDVPGAGSGEDVFPLRLAPGSTNPFRADVALEVELTRAGDVRLAVYDVRGRVVAELFRGGMAAGVHTLTWDGRGSAGRTVPPGVYFARLDSAEGIVVKRLVRVD